jgi:hypothetical protein
MPQRGILDFGNVGVYSFLCGFVPLREIFLVAAMPH